MEPITTTAATVAATETIAPVTAGAGFALCWRSAAIGAGAVLGAYGLYRLGRWTYNRVQRYRAEKALTAAAQAAAAQVSAEAQTAAEAAS